MLTLFGMSSPNVAKITILLEELGLPYRMHYVNVFSGEQYSAEFLAISPNNKVPALLDEEADGTKVAVCESGAIMLYLAEKAGKLLPRDRVSRAAALQWFMIQVSTLGPMFGQYVHFTRYAPPGNTYSQERYTSELKRILLVLEKRLTSTPYLGGDAYSIADIATYPWIRTAMSRFECLKPAAGSSTLEKYPSLRRWFETVSSRPAVRAGILSGEQFMDSDAQAVEQADANAIDRFVGRGAYSLAST